MRRDIFQAIADPTRRAIITLIALQAMTPDALEKLHKSPEWPLMEKVEHTLAYDYTILHDGTVPVDAAKKATMPALVMSGEKSFDFMSNAAKNLTNIMPNAQWKTLKGQTHQPSPEIMVPVLMDFFKR